MLLRHDVTYGKDLEIITKREGNIISSSWKLSTSPWFSMYNSYDPKYKSFDVIDGILKIQEAVTFKTFSLLVAVNSEVSIIY